MVAGISYFTAAGGAGAGGGAGVGGDGVGAGGGGAGSAHALKTRLTTSIIAKQKVKLRNVLIFPPLFIFASGRHIYEPVSCSSHLSISHLHTTRLSHPWSIQRFGFG